jgi:hypothetical protein
MAMADRDQLALLLAMLLIALLLARCGPAESGGGTCHPLQADCPGVMNDYEVCPAASDLEQRVAGGLRYFSYYNCTLGRRTPTLCVSANCTLGFRY